MPEGKMPRKPRASTYKPRRIATDVRTLKAELEPEVIEDRVKRRIIMDHRKKRAKRLVRAELKRMGVKLAWVSREAIDRVAEKLARQPVSGKKKR